MSAILVEKHKSNAVSNLAQGQYSEAKTNFLNAATEAAKKPLLA